MEITRTNLKKKTLSKAETFESIIEDLEKLHPDGIPQEQIISKMVGSGVFSKVGAREYLEKIHRSGFMYEPKSGFFSWVC